MRAEERRAGGRVKQDLKSFGVIHAGSSPAPGTIDSQGKTALQRTFFAPAKVAGKPWGNFGWDDGRGFLGLRGRCQESTAPRSRRLPALGQASPPSMPPLLAVPPPQIGQDARPPGKDRPMMPPAPSPGSPSGTNRQDQPGVSGSAWPPSAYGQATATTLLMAAARW